MTTERYQQDQIDARRIDLEARLRHETDPDKRRQLKAELFGYHYGIGATGAKSALVIGTDLHLGQLKENTVQIDVAAMEMRVMEMLNKHKEAYPDAKIIFFDGETVVETPNPASLIKAMEDKTNQRIDQGKLRQASAMRMFAAAAAALFPPAMFGRQRRDPKPKAHYGKCAGCGNPTKSGAYCFKCQKAKA